MASQSLQWWQGCHSRTRHARGRGGDGKPSCPRSSWPWRAWRRGSLLSDSGHALGGSGFAALRRLWTLCLNGLGICFPRFPQIFLTAIHAGKRVRGRGRGNGRLIIATAQRSQSSGGLVALGGIVHGFCGAEFGCLAKRLAHRAKPRAFSRTVRAPVSKEPIIPVSCTAWSPL